MNAERCGVETVLEDEKRHSCYLKVFSRFWNQAGGYEGARAGTTRKDWSRGRELNPRPTDYESILERRQTAQVLEILREQSD